MSSLHLLPLFPSQRPGWSVAACSLIKGLGGRGRLWSDGYLRFPSFVYPQGAVQGRVEKQAVYTKCSEGLRRGPEKWESISSYSVAMRHDKAVLGVRRTQGFYVDRKRPFGAGSPLVPRSTRLSRGHRISRVASKRGTADKRRGRSGIHSLVLVHV